MTGLRLYALVALVLAWGGAGYFVGDMRRNNVWLQTQAKQGQQAAERLEAAQVRGDALTTALVRSQDQINQLKQEAQRGIKTKTSGRACFDGAAVRVLQHAPGITVVPTAPSGAAAADGATAAAGDNDYASDTQAGDWFISAGAQYETCRARLDALIDWHAAR